MLTSTKNPRILYVRKLQSSAQTRRAEMRYVIEGVRLAEEALEAGCHPEWVLYSEDIQSRGQKIIASFAAMGVEVTPVASHVMQAASDTKTPQGILAVLPFSRLPIPQGSNFLLVLDGIRDPGNLGTILRTAQAAGVNTVIIVPGTVDPYSPKVVRAAMGAHFRLPILQDGWDEVRNWSESLNLAVFLADSTGGQPHHEFDLVSPLALIIGGEAAGAGFQAQELAINHIHISMPGPSESLNAAVAAAILMFEVVRQRQLTRLRNR